MADTERILIVDDDVIESDCSPEQREADPAFSWFLFDLELFFTIEVANDLVWTNLDFAGVLFVVFNRLTDLVFKKIRTVTFYPFM